MRFQSFGLLLRAGRLLTLVGNRQSFPWSLLSTMQASPTLAGIIQGQDTSSPASWEAPADASCAQHPSPSHLQEWALQEAAGHASPVKTRKQRRSCHHDCHVAERSHHPGRALKDSPSAPSKVPKPSGKRTVLCSSSSYKASRWAAQACLGETGLGKGSTQVWG